MLGTRETLITRARRQGGAETVASRSWQRMAAVAAPKAWQAALARGDALLSHARALDPKEKPRPIEKPAPCPPLKARPHRLSVTEIEDLVRDPYTIYAKHILKLFPLEEIDADPGAAERGIVMHDALARFTRKFPGALPKDALSQMLAIGREAFEPYRDFPGAEAIWWPRFTRVAGWFIGAEIARRDKIENIRAEIRGELSFTVDGFDFTLSAKADRIEQWKDQSAAVLDYKTGAPPSLREAITGLAPQLPLEAAIARAGGFKDMPRAANIGEIGIFHLSGGNPPGRFISLDPGEAKASGKKLPEQLEIETCDDLADFSLARLKALIAHYADANDAVSSRAAPEMEKALRPLRSFGTHQGMVGERGRGMKERPIPETTRAVQLAVSDPSASAWVSANAGSGKTYRARATRDPASSARHAAGTDFVPYVHESRRGAHGQSSAENAARLGPARRRALDRKLALIDGGKPSRERRASARRLFATALETPGGLKVQTIHAFCDRILHQFPFEARVPAGFKVLDESSEAELLQRAQADVLREAARDPSSDLGKALALAVSTDTDIEACRNLRRGRARAAKAALSSR